jgi:hypothetical protein
MASICNDTAIRPGRRSKTRETETNNLGSLPDVGDYPLRIAQEGGYFGVLGQMPSARQDSMVSLTVSSLKVGYLRVYPTS